MPVRFWRQTQKSALLFPEPAKLARADRGKQGVALCRVKFSLKALHKMPGCFSNLVTALPLSVR
jgi:hypothetical protein